MNWRDRLATQRTEKIQKGPGGELTKPTKPLLSVLAVPRVAILEKSRLAADPAVRVDIRPVLLGLADRLGLAAVLVHRLHDADLRTLAELPEAGLRAFLLAAADTATRQAGKPPEGDTAAIYCGRCGPVYAHPSIAAVLPVVDGWPRALGCPWCFVRKAGGYVPRPRVTCETCTHWQPDTINPPAGMGNCALGNGMHYPMQRHACGSYRPSG
ncbi:MAG: hypothetical protein EPN56_02280 [Rhodanobacter sp.]|nr:MAG: hypothetical protein EPN78_06550 [Rhodanobacter sp.]TAM14626.1 MAG: hypothetical protein EPN66_02045 [Rhodanobacter sp.]TAM37418.1 MAG: hypothetical protein EPN56_02280 [Rhodanobacter sp.]